MAETGAEKAGTESKGSGSTRGKQLSKGKKSKEKAEEFEHPESGYDVPHMPLWKEAVAVVSLLCFTGFYHVGLVVTIVLAVLIFRGSMVAVAVAAVIVTVALVPLDFKPHPGRINWLLRLWTSYFGFTYNTKNVPLDPSERIMFAEFPHGVFPMGQCVSCLNIPDIFPGAKWIAGVAATVVFRCPGMRQFFSWCGIRPASKKHINRIYDEEGMHAAVVVGGVAEMFLDTSERERIVLQERKGFVKLAIQRGCHIVPAFFFGNTRLFQLCSSDQSATGGWLSKISRKLRTSIVLFYGRFFLPIPYRHRIHLAMEPMVRVTQNNEPTNEEIEEVHARVVEATKELYYKHRPRWETRDLEIE